MTDYNSLSDAELNAAIAVRVCGWYDLIAYENNSKAKPPGKPRSKLIPNYCGDIRWAFSAQSALAAKGEMYFHEYKMTLIRGWGKPNREGNTPIRDINRFLITADARTRCVALLQAVDAIDGVPNA